VHRLFRLGGIIVELTKKENRHEHGEAALTPEGTVEGTVE
jgi:hypothetical protein